jgi:hypothetical protein
MELLKFYFFVLLLVIAGCKNKSKNISNAATVSADQTEYLDGPEISGVPKEVMVKLLNECTFIDYIFHDLPFSLSQAEDPSIDQNIEFIDFKRPLGRIPKGCKPIARKFFQIKGEIVYDVDVYLSDKCKFYVFVDKKNKPVYANFMTESGIKFYTQVVEQARGAIPHQ